MGEELFAKGREGIMIHAKTVVRPHKPWSKTVQLFLKYMQDKGVDFVPRPLGFDQAGNEMVSFMNGSVYDYPLPQQAMTEDSIRSAAKLLKNFHDKGSGFLETLSGEEVWMLAIDLPNEVMCHGDFAPYNVTMTDNKALGLIDFDTLRPGSRIWDIAYGAYRWVPFFNLDTQNHTLNLDSQIQRLKIFLDEYGVNNGERQSLIEMMIERISYLIKYMMQEARLGESNFQQNIKEGHIEQYKKDIAYLKQNGTKITAAIRK